MKPGVPACPILNYCKKLRQLLPVGLLVLLAVLRPAAGIAQVNVYDSLALISFYSSTNGANWTNHTNWLTTKPVATWYGVFVGNQRVDSLSLRNNNLTGKIPPQIGSLSGLGFLSLSHNKLTDTIPAALGQLANLQSLDVSSNTLTGKIPSQIGNLAQLYFLDVSYNQFSGTIPASVFNLANLQVLNLSNNTFTGSLPSTAANFSLLSYLDVSFNNLSGTVPAWMAFPGIAMGLTVNINNNQFTFAGMAAFAAGNNAGGYFTYAPQAAIPLVKTGSTVQVSAGGKPGTETFKLYKNGTLAATKTGDSVFTLTASGTYYIAVTSSAANQLTLTSQTATYLAGPAIAIAANTSSAICAGAPVTFTATAAAGTSQTYQWKKDGKNVGTNSAKYIDAALKNNDSVVCVLTVGGVAYTSNQLKFTVNPLVTPQVTITASSAAAICKGTKVVFTAAKTNGGSSPVLQWKKNGKNVGTNSTQYIDSTLKTGDSVYVVLKSDASCLAMDSVASKAIKFTVNALVTPAVAITASTLPAICKGTKVQFTAVATGGGGAPVYQWKKDGKNVGTNSTKYVDSTLKTGDSVYVVLKSDEPCLAVDTAVSKAVKFTVITAEAPSINIIASQGDTICKGTLVVLQASAVNVGALVVYEEWKKDGKIVGKDSLAYTDSLLNNGDSVTCTVIIKGACITDSIVISKTIKFTVIATPALPSAIKGDATVTAGKTNGYKVSAEPGATFVWLVPAGDTIVHGQGTDSITVKWGKTGGTAKLSVRALDRCGTSETVTKSVSITGSVVEEPVNNKIVPSALPLNAVLYPNPAVNDATLLVNGGTEAKVLVTITSLDGKLLWSGQVAANSVLALPNSKLAAGIYLITVTNGKETKTLKLAKGN